MYKILLLISVFFIIACNNSKNTTLADYYSPVKSQLKEYIIPTKCQDIRICLPDSFAAYQGIADLSGVDDGIDEIWYKSNRNDCSIHIKIYGNGKSFKAEESIQNNIIGIAIANPGALVYTKQLTNNKDTIYYLNCLEKMQDDNNIDIAYTTLSCFIIKNDILYHIILDAKTTGSVIDLELYDEIINSVRIVD